MTLDVACPSCGRKVKLNELHPWRPFCSERCRLIDLGQCASEEHRIGGEPATDSDLNTPGSSS